MRWAQNRARSATFQNCGAWSTTIKSRALGALKLASEARGENVPAKRADLFFYSFILSNINISQSLTLEPKYLFFFLFFYLIQYQYFSVFNSWAKIFIFFLFFHLIQYQYFSVFNSWAKIFIFFSVLSSYPISIFLSL